MSLRFPNGQIASWSLCLLLHERKRASYFVLQFFFPSGASLITEKDAFLKSWICLDGSLRIMHAQKTTRTTLTVQNSNFGFNGSSLDPKGSFFPIFFFFIHYRIRLLHNLLKQAYREGLACAIEHQRPLYSDCCSFCLQSLHEFHEPFVDQNVAHQNDFEEGCFH